MFNSVLLSEYLEREHISKVDFAEQIGVSQAMMTYLCKGLKNPSLVTLKRIIELTGIEANEWVI